MTPTTPKWYATKLRYAPYKLQAYLFVLLSVPFLLDNTN